MLLKRIQRGRRPRKGMDATVSWEFLIVAYLDEAGLKSALDSSAFCPEIIKLFRPGDSMYKKCLFVYFLRP